MVSGTRQGAAEREEGGARLQDIAGSRALLASQARRGEGVAIADL
jgi:hypothetical protein